LALLIDQAAATFVLFVAIDGQAANLAEGRPAEQISLSDQLFGTSHGGSS
jgi:hypothetical protein